MLLSDGAARVWATDFKTRVYFNADACRAARTLSENECLTAYSNAKAEFDEKAPRFSTRTECERHFRRCMIGDISGRGGKVTFIPAMRGFRMDAGRQYRVLPVAEGGEADPLFQARAVDRVNSFVSAARAAEARIAWRALISPPAPGANAFQGPPGADDFGYAPASGAPETYPLPAAMLQDLKNRERMFGAASKF